MAYASGAGNPMPDVFMDGHSFSNEMLGEPFGISKANDGTAFNVSSPRFAASSVSGADLEAAMQSVLSIFQLDEDTPKQNGGDEMDENDAFHEVDVDDQARRTQRLRGICLALDKLWWSSSDFMIKAAEKLADGSRDPKWRIPMGESGILNSFLAIVATKGVQQPLMVHVLRLIGNSCADTNENRESVVSIQSIPAIISLLKESALLPFVIPVLFNICVDYEPAQKQASESQMTKALIELISSPTFSESRVFLGYICKLLDMMIEHPAEAEIAPDNVPLVLFNLAFDSEFATDLEDFLSLSNAGINYLHYVRFQKGLVKNGIEAAIRILLFSYTRFDIQQDTLESSISQREDAKLLTLMRSNMNQVLSNVSALPEFSAQYPVLSPTVGNLRRFLSSPQIQLQVCACIMLGNTARSDKACEEFVYTSRVHKPLIAVLTDVTDSQLLHATLGFLKNLALPARNKVELGNAGLMDILPRLWTMDVLPQIQYSSISLARQLIIGNFYNVRRICKRLTEDPSSPANERSKLSILISISQHTDAEPIKMEIARLLTAICRVFTSPNQNINDIERRRKNFFERHPDVGRPLSFMVSQKKWPVFRSEGWFAMALMARSPEGAECVADIMHDPNVFQPLVELLTGKSIVGGTPTGSPSSNGNVVATDGSSPAASLSGANSRDAILQRVDRENALVLVSELLRQRGPQMASLRRSVFEELLQGGGLMHLSYAQVQEREDFFDGKVQRMNSGQSVQEAAEASAQEVMT